MISQLSDLILKREFFPFLLRKTKTEKGREDEPSAGKVSASEAAPGGNLRVCVKKTSCLPNDGSTLTDTNLTNKGKSVIGTMKYQFFWQPTSLKAGGEKKKQGIGRCRGRRLEETPHYGCQPPAARPRNSQEVVRSGICLVGYILRVRFLSTKITALPWNIQTFN